MLLRIIERQRNPQLAPQEEAEVGGRHSDHAIALVIELDRPSDDALIRLEAAPPETVAENGDAFAARAVLFGQKVATKQHRRAECREEARRDAVALQSLRLAHAGQRQI